MPSEGLFSFDRFQLDLSTGRLSGRSGPIPLAPKALAVLEYLAARPGQLIGKDELLAAIWPGVFLGDGALKVCVSEIRRALHDDRRFERQDIRLHQVQHASQPLLEFQQIWAVDFGVPATLGFPRLAKRFVGWLLEECPTDILARIQGQQ